MITQGNALSLLELAQRVMHARAEILKEVRHFVVGQEHLVEQLLIVTFAGGHGLLEGPAGSGRTLAARTLARLLQLEYSQIQCHPELTADDIIGREVSRCASPWDPSCREFHRGPLFANLVVADEIDRASHRAQDSLLQPMVTRGIVAPGGERFQLPAPFSLFATRNIGERQQVFPISDAIADRFMLCVQTSEPDRDMEIQIADQATRTPADVPPVLRARDVLWIQQLAQRLIVPGPIVDYAVDLVRATRPGQRMSPAWLGMWLSRGAGNRATQAILATAKIRALIHGRVIVHPADVRAVLADALRHRVQWIPEVAARGVTMEHLVEALVQLVPVNTRAPAESAPLELEMLDPGDMLPPCIDDTCPSQSFFASGRLAESQMLPVPGFPAQ